MNFFSVLRLLLAVTLPIYALFHIRGNCPLDEPLSAQAVNNPLCLYSHKVNDFMVPYISVVTERYATSPLKPQVDSIYESSKVFIDPYLQKSSDLFTSLKDEAFQRTNITQEELFANLESGSKLLGGHLTTIINFINHEITNVIYPFSVKTTNLIIQYSKLFYVKSKLFIYIQWKMYIQPFTAIVKYHFFNTQVGKYCIEFSQTDEFKLVKFYINEAESWVVSFFHYINEKWSTFKEANDAMSMSKSFKLMEDKKNFLLQELNKFLDNSFNKVDTEELTETIRSTITITSTSVKTTPTVVVSKSSDKYQSLLDKTIEGARIDFESQVSSLSHQFSANLNSNFIEKLQKFGANVNSNYDYIYDLLSRINLVPVPESSGYVSRQDYRDALEERRLSFIAEAGELENEIEKYKVDFISNVSNIRNSILEALEEFSDSSLNAYSAEIVSNDSDWVEWKKFNSLKSQLISFRDELINYDIEKINHDFIVSINGIKTQINILLNEGGSYLAILRAKANLEFQSRERATTESTKIETHTVLEIIPLEEIQETQTQTKTVLEIIPLESKKSELNDKIIEIVDDTVKAGAIEVAYEAAELVEPVIEDVLNAANELVADAIIL